MSALLRRGRVKLTQVGVISVLEQLLSQSKSTEYAYLCDPAVQHVSKLKKEGIVVAKTLLGKADAQSHLGGFCGYRNIQMMISYIIGANAPGVDRFQGRLPTIFEIQELIERAWDLGINSQGRVETGGIKGTRKYIGTPEVRRGPTGNIIEFLA